MKSTPLARRRCHFLRYAGLIDHVDDQRAALAPSSTPAGPSTASSPVGRSGTIGDDGCGARGHVLLDDARWRRSATLLANAFSNASYATMVLACLDEVFHHRRP